MGRVEQRKEYEYTDENGETVVGSYVWDSYFVHDSLLDTYHRELPQHYDLSGFNVPITDLDMAKRLDGLTTQSIRVSRNFEHNARLNEFYDTFIEPDELQCEFNGQVLTFRDQEMNLFGERGSMLHLRRQSPESALSEMPLRMLAVISHIDDAQPATLLTATRHDPLRHDAIPTSNYLIGKPEDLSLQLVDRPTAFEWDIEQILQADEAVAAQAEIKIIGGNISYRRSDRQWEMCRSLETFRKRVGVALSRGLGYASMSHERSEEVLETGQLGQKVLG